MNNKDKLISENVGNIIKTKRKYKNISQTELGEYLGVSHATISRYESGKIPITVDSMNNIANYCDFRPTEYMKAFCTDEEVKTSLRKIVGKDSNVELTDKAEKLENEIAKSIPDDIKPALISSAYTIDLLQDKDTIKADMRNLVINIMTVNNDALSKRLLKYAELLKSKQ